MKNLFYIELEKGLYNYAEYVTDLEWVREETPSNSFINDNELIGYSDMYKTIQPIEFYNKENGYYIKVPENTYIILDTIRTFDDDGNYKDWIVGIMPGYDYEKYE